MKKLFVLVTFLLLFASFVSSQDSTLFNYYLKGNPGTKCKFGMYSASDKRFGEQTNEITNVFVQNDTSFIEYKTTTGNIVVKYFVKCKDSISYLDVVNYLDIANYVKTKVSTITPEWLPLPVNLFIGRSLEGYILERKYGTRSIYTKLLNRKVEGIDTITCPAGTFECIKITYQMEGTTQSGAVYNAYYTDWLNKEVGLVKQTLSRSQGKLDNYFLLESITRK